MIIIGEKINSSIPSMAEAISRRDEAYITKIAVEQAGKGVHFIDVNAGAFVDAERELLPWLVKVVQNVVAVPLCIDSPDPVALEKAMACHQGKPIINSISLEKDRYGSVLPLVKGGAAGVIALCMDDAGIPKTAEQRTAVAYRLVDRLIADGVAFADIYLDAMVQPLGTDWLSGKAALDAVRLITTELPGIHITCGLSNVSFGLPKRQLLNQAFAVALAAYGLDTFFIDPLDNRMMSLLRAIQALTGQDEYCSDYIDAYRAGLMQ
jgi:5-methyltetrahydrofolate--homocysteine methyltransferase